MQLQAVTRCKLGEISGDELILLMQDECLKGPRQSNSDDCVLIADTVTHSSVQSDCQQSAKTAHMF